MSRLSPFTKFQRAAYTPAEVAIMLGCSKGAVLKAIQRGDLPALRFGRVIRIPAEKLSQVLECQTTGLPAIAANSPSPSMTTRESAAVIRLGRLTR